MARRIAARGAPCLHEQHTSKDVSRIASRTPPAGGRLETRANPSAIWTPTRSWRQMTGLMPTAAAASMIGVVGKQKSVEMPSRLRMSAITSMTSIDGSSQRSFAVPVTAPADGRSLALARCQCQPAAAGVADVAVICKKNSEDAGISRGLLGSWVGEEQELQRECRLILAVITAIMVPRICLYVSSEN